MQNQKTHTQPLLGDDGELLEARVDSQQTSVESAKKKSVVLLREQPTKSIFVLILATTWIGLTALVFSIANPKVVVAAPWIDLGLIVLITWLGYQGTAWYDRVGHPSFLKPLRTIYMDAVGLVTKVACLLLFGGILILPGLIWRFSTRSRYWWW